MKAFRGLFSSRSLVLACVAALLTFFVLPDILEARGGRGGRSSFGGSRSSRSYSSPKKSNSFGGTRSKTSQSQRTTVSPKMSTQQARAKYGIPRKSEPIRPASGSYAGQNVVVHRYGGMSDGFMTGYLMGSTSWMWSMPFHPAFYYSRPVYVTNEQGVTEVYPPTFSFLKLLIGLTILAVIAVIIKKVFFSSKGKSKNVLTSQSSFS